MLTIDSLIRESKTSKVEYNEGIQGTIRVSTGADADNRVAAGNCISKHWAMFIEMPYDMFKNKSLFRRERTGSEERYALPMQFLVEYRLYTRLSKRKHDEIPKTQFYRLGIFRQSIVRRACWLLVRIGNYWRQSRASDNLWNQWSFKAFPSIQEPFQIIRRTLSSFQFPKNTASDLNFCQKH
jgi:hypothetical protein